MSLRAAQQAVPSGAAKLAIFPLDEVAIQRLVQCLTRDQLHQHRLTALSALTPLLDALVKELGAVERLVEQLGQTALPGTALDIVPLTETVKRLSVMLDCARK